MSSLGAYCFCVLQVPVANRLILAGAMVSNVLFFPSFAAFILKSFLKNALKSQFWSLGVEIRFLEVGFCACGAYCYCVLQALLSNRLIVLARRCSCGTVRCVL